MYKHDYSKHSTNSARVAIALCALAALGVQAAQAQATKVTDPSQLGNTVLTAQYPFDPNNTIVPPSFNRPTVNGSNNLTFTATKAPAGGGFQSFQVSPTDAAPQFTSAPFGVAGDIAENTTFAAGGTIGNIPTAPLLIQFANPVSGFGLLAQNFNADTETFTLNVFADSNATIPLNILPFTFTADNSVGLGTALFVGAQLSGLPLIKSATLSSFSVAVGANPNNGSNDFAFGRTFVQAPVPEASTMVSFGMGVLLFAGLALGAYKRKVQTTSQPAPQTAG